jgi:hypothetical protein
MTDKTIRETINNLRTDLIKTLGQRDRLNLKLIELQNQIKSLEAVHARNVLMTMQSEEQSIVGLSEAIRSIMRIKGRPMTPADVKEDLDVLGFNFGRFSNPSAAIHSTMKRMAGTGELEYSRPNYKLLNLFSK